MLALVSEYVNNQRNVCLVELPACACSRMLTHACACLGICTCAKSITVRCTIIALTTSEKRSIVPDTHAHEHSTDQRTYAWQNAAGHGTEAQQQDDCARFRIVQQNAVAVLERRWNQ